jgi:phosphoserine phosphatase
MSKTRTNRKRIVPSPQYQTEQSFLPKAIVFDFEGTLTTSDSDRTTWERLWSELDYPDSESARLEHRYARGEIDHAQWCLLTLQKFKAKGLTREQVRSVGKSIKLIDGFEIAIERIYEQGIPMYILSGSIWDVVNSVIGDFKKYFQGIWANNFAYTDDGIIENIFGTRYDFEGKAEFVKNRASELKIPTAQILFVGNSDNDEKVKELSGAKTLLVNPHRTRVSKAWDYYIPHMKSLTEILPYVGILDSTRNEQAETKRKVEQLIALLKQEEVFNLSTYTVIGGYRRFNRRTRTQLRSLAEKITTSLLNKPFGRQNYLISAAPGSGKTYFVQEIANSLKDKIRFVEIDLSKDSKEQMRQKLESVGTGETPCLCMIDEVDGAAGEEWPYELIYKQLDLNDDSKCPITIVFTLIGSSGGNINGLTEVIKARHKGRDLIDRISKSQEYYIEIPSLEIGDGICVYISKVLEAAARRGLRITHLEKMAAFYAGMTALHSPRQIKMLADHAVGRVNERSTVLRYDNHFEVGAAENKNFWNQYQIAVKALSGEELQIIS